MLILMVLQVDSECSEVQEATAPRNRDDEGFYRSRMLTFDNAFARCCIYVYVYVGGLTLF